MEQNSHLISLTNKQEQKLAQVMDAFYDRATSSSAFPPKMLLLIGGVRRSILDRDSLEQYQIDVCLWVIELLLDQLGDDEVDPLLEQAFHKLAGWWPIEPPWYERV